MKKHMMILIILVIIVFLAVTSIGVAEQGLTVWMKKGFVEEQNTMFVEKVNEFAKEKGITVNVNMIAYEDFFPKWAAAIQSGDVPDVTYLGYEEVAQFQGRGILEDLTDTISVIENKSGDFFEKSLIPITFKDKIMAIPFWGEGMVMYYRKDYLEQAGIATYPKNWEEFREFTKKMTNASKGIYGAGIGYGANNSDAEWLSRALIWSFGGSIFDETGTKIVFNSPETIKAVEYVKSIFNEDKSTPPTAMGWDDGGNNTSYLSGQAAIVFNVGSILKAIRAEDPELLKVTGIAPIPGGPAGSFTMGIINTLAIFKESKNKDLARELLVYLLDPEWYAEWIKASAPLAIPVLKELENEAVWEDEYNKPFIDTMKQFVFSGYKGPVQPASGEIANLRLLNNLFARVILKNVPVEDAVKEFTIEAEKILNK